MSLGSQQHRGETIGIPEAVDHVESVEGPLEFGAIEDEIGGDDVEPDPRGDARPEFGLVAGDGDARAIEDGVQGGRR